MSIRNLINNRLYNECNFPVDNSNLILNAYNNKISCGNTCKNHVEILKNIENNEKMPLDDCENVTKINRKCIITIDDCDCEQKYIQVKEQFDDPKIILVENRGYDAKISCNYIPEKKLKDDYTAKKIQCKNRDLSSSDLLKMAKQIATGMVNF